MFGTNYITASLGALLLQISFALWFAPLKEPPRPWPPQKLPCTYDINLQKTNWPKKHSLAILVIDYDSIAYEEFSAKVYKAYFAHWHTKITELLPVYPLYSSQEGVLWDLEYNFLPTNKLKIPCGYIDDPNNSEKYAYTPGLYLYEENKLKLSYFQFPFFETNSEVAELVVEDIKRFARGQPVHYPPIHVLSQERIKPPEELNLPAFVMLLTGTEWDAPPNETPLKKPRVLKGPEGNILDYQEFPSGHIGARGRYIMQNITPLLKRIGINPVGLIPPDEVIREILNTNETNFIEKMSSAFPDWTFIQLTPPNVIRYRELTVYPCAIYSNGVVKCLKFYTTKPQVGDYRNVEELMDFLSSP